MIEAVFFDLDETLLDRTTSLRAFLGDQFERNRARLGNVEFGSWLDRFLELDERGHVHKTIVYPSILAEFGGDPNAGRDLFAEYVARCSAFAVPFEDMASTLTLLRSDGLRLGVITNGETEFQTKHVEALSLHHLVDTILISQSEGLRKPERAIFQRAAGRLDVQLGSCLFVGEYPVADVIGASLAGMQTAWFQRTLNWPLDQPANPGATIGHLKEILNIVGATG